MLRVRNVAKSYRQGGAQVLAVDGVSLDVAAGEFVSIMGPSGSGKSTLLHLMGGVDLPDAGEIVIEGRNLVAMSDDEITLLRRRRIGFVFQFFNLLPTMSAADNVALPLLLDGVAKAEIATRVQEALRAVDMQRRAGHRPDELSGGEMQRIAIARALVIEPALLLADEPTGNLDSATGRDVLSLLRDAGGRFARATVMVTHDSQAAACGQRILHMKDGRMVAATPAGFGAPKIAVLRGGAHGGGG